MKYIRTKDGIYKANSQIKPEEELQVKWIDDHCFETSWKTKPCEWKQADTIEELCDMFVVALENNKNRVFEKLQYAKDTAELFFWDKAKIVYGAIWTEKGLIYVAELNEKGELELL